MSWGGTSPDSVRRFAAKHGMSAKDAPEFHANHIRLPLPWTASDVLEGPLPGTDRRGELAWLEFSSAVDVQRNYNAVVVAGERDLPARWVDADDVTIPGFGDAVPEDALAVALAHGLGFSSHGRQTCVYRAMPPGAAGWPSEAELEAFIPRALASPMRSCSAECSNTTGRAGYSRRARGGPI